MNHLYNSYCTIYDIFSRRNFFLGGSIPTRLHGSPSSLSSLSSLVVVIVSHAVQKDAFRRIFANMASSESESELDEDASYPVSDCCRLMGDLLLTGLRDQIYKKMENIINKFLINIQ